MSEDLIVNVIGLAGARSWPGCFRGGIHELAQMVREASAVLCSVPAAALVRTAYSYQAGVVVLALFPAWSVVTFILNNNVYSSMMAWVDVSGQS